MSQSVINQTLWTNIAALMQIRYGKENLGKLAADAHIGPATMTRIKEQQTSIGTEKLDQIAAALAVQSWQLLCPGYDFKSQPVAQAAGPLLRGDDLQKLFDLIPADAPTREPAYFTCFDALMMARRQAASQPTRGIAQAQNQETPHDERQQMPLPVRSPSKNQAGQP